MANPNDHNNNPDGQLHVYFFPFMAHGHRIPAIDMAKLFAGRGVKTTIVTTPLNALHLSKTIHKHSSGKAEIRIRGLDFRPTEFGLPAECENLEFIFTHNLGWEGMSQFFRATTMLQEPFEKLLEQDRPDCLVADMLFPWATESASKFGIPRLVFHSISFFALSVNEALAAHQPQSHVSSDTESFVVPGLPDEVRFTKRQLPPLTPGGSQDNDFMSRFFERARKSSYECYGTVVNSFYELEPGYADCYKRVLGRKTWHVGPVSLCNADVDDKAIRGKEAAIDLGECLKWLDSKEPNTVVYISFGSLVKFSAEQLKEIAIGIEASDQQFIWVVRQGKNDNNNWLPEGFEERTKGRGMVIKGWAPQVLILEHMAIAAFVTHCGWNSTLEGIIAGLPMVTWPVMADQFYNEKLVTEVAKIRVGIGGEERPVYGGMVGCTTIKSAMKRIMSREDEDVIEMRRRAKALGEMARKAVEEGGSSYSDLCTLIEELSSQREA